MPTSLPRGERTRAISVGDKMTYDLTLSMTNPSGERVGPVQGSVSLEVRKGFKQGKIPSEIKNTFHISEQFQIGATATGRIAFVGQDADGAIYLLGRLDEGEDWTLVKDKDLKMDIPAVLSDGKSWGYTVHLSNGKTETDTFKIVGVENVKTPAGEFEAYKVKVETKVKDGKQENGYVWIRPEFPRPIKLRLDLSNKKTPEKGTTSLEQVLKSYKLAE